MTLKQIAEIDFPTRWATFRLLAFESLHKNKKTNQESIETALALVLGDIGSFPPLVRIHSQCITGEVFHSLRCDCHDQLQLALRAIAQEGSGVLIYEQQEGRGIGLMEKIRAYELQDQGFDTVEANLRLGHVVDARDYILAVEVLRILKICTIRLISNNPEKIKAVLASGIQIVERVSADVPGSIHSTRYLSTKREKLGHLSNPALDSLAREILSADGGLLTETRNETPAPAPELQGNVGGGQWQMS
jgi:GTP cyclohydrolase II